jgi:hypothetical protein
MITAQQVKALGIAAIALLSTSIALAGGGTISKAAYKAKPHRKKDSAAILNAPTTAI